MSIKRHEIASGGFRTDGYYYSQNSPDFEGETGYSIMFFYLDGVCLFSSVYEKGDSDLNVFETNILDGQIYDNAIRSKSAWGAYFVESNEIHYETWKPELSGCYTVLVHRAEILNDTTILFFSDKGSDTSYFKHFPKPDSTNNLI